MVCVKCKSKCKVVLFCNSCYQNSKLEAEKRGAKEELEKEKVYFEGMLSKVTIELNKLKKKPIIKSNKFWASMLYVIEIQRIEKRLKSLEEKKIVDRTFKQVVKWKQEGKF